jgi:hypothetical protein
MLALLFSLAAFLVWCTVGLALLVAVRLDLTSLRVLLTAPAVGSATFVLPLIVLSNAGVSMDRGALPTLVVLLIGSVVVLVWRRSLVRPPITALPVLGIAVATLFLVGRPMLDFGFHWFANANDDMTNYVLSAIQLQHHGLIAPLDVAGLLHDRDYATSLQILHSAGARPGSDITLAAFASLTGRLPSGLFMPLIVAFNVCGVCAAGALAMQWSRRWWAASIAALLLAVSPLAAYGVVQQLLPQVWGLALAAALCALLMRPELHSEDGPRWGDVVVVGGLAAALIGVYVELATTILLAYAVYVGVLVLHRDIGRRAIVRLWGPVLLIVLLVLNTYLVREISFVSGQATTGFGTGGKGIFDYSLVPAALPAIAGLVTLGASHGGTPHLERDIIISIVALALVLVGVCVWAWRGMAAATVLAADLVIGVLLGIRSNGFGLFKLYMYVQPFLAAALGVWLATLSRRAVVALGAVVLGLTVVTLTETQRLYVDQSRVATTPRNLSASDMLPAFSRLFASARVPVVAVTENPVLGKLEAASVGNRPLFFVSRDFFSDLLDQKLMREDAALRRETSHYLRARQWKPRVFDLRTAARPRLDPFLDNEHASRILSTGRCVIVMPSGTQYAFNRRSLPEGSPDLVKVPCTGTRNLLAFTYSHLGQSYYLFTNRRFVSFYQLEPDYFFPGQTFMGFGRYALFRVLGPSSTVRLELDLTRTLTHDGVNALPPAAAVGAARVDLPLVGSGSARVFSPPLRPQMIDGQPYLLLDMGVNGRQTPVPRVGVEGLYGTGIELDPRFLTSYVRNVSLVSGAQYRRLKAPSVLQHFPADLGNPDLEYSGIYEDGWVGGDSYVFLAGGDAADLVVRAKVRSISGQRLVVFVDGRRVAAINVKPGALDLRVPVPASDSRRKVELRWARSPRLQAPDLRPAAALLSFLGVVPR